jgi:hypothetical protein
VNSAKVTGGTPPAPLQAILLPVFMQKITKFDKLFEDFFF